MSEGREVTWICYVSYADVSDIDAVSCHHMMDRICYVSYADVSDIDAVSCHHMMDRICYVSYAEVSAIDAVSCNHMMDNFKSADANNAVFRIFWNLN
jgi:catabolite regulation protein CreA